MHELLTGPHDHLVPEGALGLVRSSCHMHLPSQWSGFS